MDKNKNPFSIEKGFLKINGISYYLETKRNSCVNYGTIKTKLIYFP